MSVSGAKPLGRKAYGSIGHLPGSRMGPADHHCHPGQARICLERARDKHDRIIAQEKLDGSCVAAAKIQGEIVALGRRGYLASSSPHEQHHLWAEWVDRHAPRFQYVLDEGERLVGEWLALAHGTRYDRAGGDPFVAFDLMRDDKREPWAVLCARLAGCFCLPAVISAYEGPVSIEQVQEHYARYGSAHGAIDPVEGAVWRVERDDPRKGYHVDFLAKWVRPDKQDGCYLPEVSGQPPVWNWRPE